MSINAVTLYDVSGDKAEPLAVFRFVNGKIEAESLVRGSVFIDMWLEGTWDPQEERMVTPDEGERYLQALIERPMTYFRFEPGEPDPSFGRQRVE